MKAKTSKKSNVSSAASNEADAAAGVLTMEEAIDILKTTRPTFYRWLRGGQLKGMKVGRQWRFLRGDIERFLKGQAPRIDLPADIGPLIQELDSRLKELGVRCPAETGQDKVARAAYLMIRLGIAMKASDIHIEPQEGGAVLRLRVHGVLHAVCRFDLRLLPAVVERWKSLAALDVREKSLPQDGRIVMDVDGRNADLRLCCVPAYLGESIVARLLWTDNLCLDLDRMEYAPSDRQRLDKWIKAPRGLILLTGPTGCGKTTTLYSCLMRTISESTKVVSVEDPVEYLLPGMTQISVNPKVGLTFERALRSVLRMDPDVIMIGEIRNSEAMHLCFQAAMTGHLVMTTMHVDEAAAALRRMIDLDCEPFLVADSTKLILAQRLVRKLCPDCSAEAMPGAELLSRAEKFARTGGLGWDALPKQYRKAVGCRQCGQLGYRGRTLIAETLEVTPEIASALRRKASTEEIRAIAVGQGMTTMAADGVRRAAGGIVSLAEALAAVGSIGY